MSNRVNAQASAAQPFAQSGEYPHSAHRRASRTGQQPLQSAAQAGLADSFRLEITNMNAYQKTNKR